MYITRIKDLLVRLEQSPFVEKNQVWLLTGLVRSSVWDYLITVCLSW